MSGLFYQGDNMAALSRVASASVDLVYLDPPLCTGRDFHIGREVVFTDKWKWTAKSDTTFWALRRSAPELWSMVGALVELHGRTGTSAYLLDMAERLHALGRVLKSTGSLYLHCDTTAGHYLRTLLDGVFTPARFRSQIVWRRNAGAGPARSHGAVYDILLHYAAGDETTWTGDGGHTDLWEDIAPVGQASSERTGYPTQKPEELLVRILEASSRPGDMVLDPYAGSGTALAVAEQLGRSWIGMDVGTKSWTVVDQRLRRIPGASYEVVRI